MAHDELAIARRFKEDILALVKRYPGLLSEEAQARLNDYICKQKDDISIHTEGKECSMPAKGQRTIQGEDTYIETVRLPQSARAAIDQHLVRMRRQRPRWEKLTHSDALRDLVLSRIDELEAADLSLATVAQAPEPPLSAGAVQHVSEKLATLQDLHKEQEGHIERMSDLIESIPDPVPPVTKPRPAKATRRPRARKGGPK